MCDVSARPSDERLWPDNPPIALPASRDPLPKNWPALDPRRLILRPNTAVVAALWAVSLGCHPVAMLGCGCEDDGRRPDQLAAMRGARRELLDAAYRREGDWRPLVWPWPRCVSENPVMWASYTLSPRLAPPAGAIAAERVREFYDHN